MTDNTAKVHFRVIRFIHEAGLRLRLKSVPLATACIIYHRFFKEYTLQQYDPYLIASTTLYIAGKVEENQVTLRDVVNVCYRTLHRSKPPLEMGDMFFALKETIAKCELFVLRALQFRVVYNHPHRYLLHYLTFIKEWMEPYKWDELPLARTSWALLRDSYHSTLCLQYKPQHIAVAILYMTLESHGADIPFEDTAVTPWWKVFAEDITLDIIKQIVGELINTYDLEMISS
ncbi:Hypothetical predicted protein [Mytilus galloprovincialis]|uniref:Cyclin-Q n=1 Tax=Mytilus galloprovincialis TaxID=29158 RepID=A0A8B6H5D2_MYTGA|nr:Hypothetical predicted protein [Mytilus galloprovincialis]